MSQDNKKICLYLLGSFFAIIAFFTINYYVSIKPAMERQAAEDKVEAAEEAKEAAIEAAEQHRQDSLQAVYKAKQDSINSAVRASYKHKFVEQTDEFSGTTWTYHKSNHPKYRNRNACYCYFSGQYNFRFVFQYDADSWLFIDHMIFNVDGLNYEVYPSDMKRDCGYGGEIWEWCDEGVGGGDIQELVEAIAAGAKTVKVKMVGQQYCDTRTLTRNEVRSIKETYEYFIACGGELI